MTRALISVSDDGFTYISLNGATSRYSDTGQAIAYLGDYARETATALSVTIDDGAKKTEVSIDENGKLASSSARAGSGAGAESDAEATDSADRADQRTDAEATASAAGTQPSAASGSSQTADPSESTEQPTPAESSDGRFFGRQRILGRCRWCRRGGRRFG
jgi:activator of HSP90 ATPase